MQCFQGAGSKQGVSWGKNSNENNLNWQLEACKHACNVNPIRICDICCVLNDFIAIKSAFFRKREKKKETSYRVIPV